MGISWATSEHSRKSMLGNRSQDTEAEMRIRRLAHQSGMRYRVHRRPEPDLRCTADMLFTRQRIAVFIDGCYWHGCEEHYRQPSANSEYWAAKIERNRLRDLETSGVLEERGWTVLRFWEHEPPESVVESIRSSVLRGTRV